MEKEVNDLPENGAEVPETAKGAAVGRQGNAIPAGASPREDGAAARAADVAATRRNVRPGTRRSPSSAANRKFDRDTAAKVEEWRVRQATRAVPMGYKQGAGGHMPPSVLTSDADVLDAQNEIPEQGRPVRTRPSIPNYEPRIDPLDEQAFEAVGAHEDVALDAEMVEARGDGIRAAAQNATDALLGSAAKAGEAGSALLEDIRHSDAADAAKGFASRIPGCLKRAAKRVSAVYRGDDGAIRRKPAAITAAVVVYLLVAAYFSFHYYPNTTIGSVQVGGMDVQEASAALGDAVDGYALKVEGDNDVSFVVMGSEAGMTLDAEDLARQAMAADSGLYWPLGILLPHDHSDIMAASADTAGYRQKISDAVNYYNENATMPRDATISYDKEAKTFTIVPEETGDALNEDAIAAHVAEAISDMRDTLVLGPDDYLKPAVYQDDERLKAALAEAQRIAQANIAFEAHGETVETLTGETAATWVLTDENVALALDEDKLNAWVQALVDKVSTVGDKRTWTREDGQKCTVEGGVYGWEADWLALDEKLHVALGIGTGEAADGDAGGEAVPADSNGVQTIEIPMQQEAAAYNGANARDWKSYIDVDLDAQHATYYDDDGKVLWESDFVSGAPDGEHDTPQGVYFINNKESPSTLVGDTNGTGGPEYRTEVQYWMPWRGNDVGFHDAEWQDEFGGTRYLDGFGSHGCINLSEEKVAKLYKIADIGTVVVCHGSKDVSAKRADAEAEE